MGDLGWCGCRVRAPQELQPAVGTSIPYSAEGGGAPYVRVFDQFWRTLAMQRDFASADAPGCAPPRPPAPLTRSLPDISVRHASTGAGGDNGIAKLWNRRGISVSSYDDQSHYLHPHHRPAY
eukprot:COSAG01_NODE_1628_length_9684_cov_9.777673_4_plen_122_part_00